MADDARLQIVLEAKIDKLTDKLSEANRNVHSSAAKMQQDIEETNSKWEKLFLGEGPQKAIENVFSRSRLAVLEEGGAKIGVFGTALEALGPAGIAAGAGLFALGEAAEQVRRAMEFASDLEKTARSLGITTTALQEYDAAAIATGVGRDKAREGIAAFNEVFGKYASGLATPRQGKFLNALGFTPQDARQITDVSDALEKALLAIAKIPNGSERASLAESTGLTDFLPIIGQGTDGIEEFIAKMREARDTGEIISPQQIARAAELNEKVEALSHQIGQEFKQAFIDLAPEVEAGFENMERLASQVAHLIALVPDAVRGLADIASAAGRIPGLGGRGGLLDLSGFRQLQDQGAANDAAYSKMVHAGTDPSSKVAAFINDVLNYDIRNAPRDLAAYHRSAATRGGLDTSAADAKAGFARENRTENDVFGGEGLSRGGRAVDLSRFNERKPKKGPEDQTASFDDAAQNADLTAQKDLTAARKEAAAALRKLTQTSTSEGAYAAAVANATAENEAKQADITADLSAKLAKYDQQVAKAEAAAAKGTDAGAAHQVALLKAARAREEEAAATRGFTAAEEAAAAQVEAARTRDIAQINQAYDLLRGVGQFTQGMHRVQGSYARSSDERRTADLTNLDDDKYLQDLARSQKLATDLRSAQGTKDEAARTQELNAQYGVDQGRADQLYAAQRQKITYDDASPFAKFAQQGVTSASQVRDAFEEIATKGLDQLNDGLADAIVNGKSLGDVFKSVFAGMEADLVKYLLKQAEVGLFGGAKNADGSAAPSFFSLLGSAFGLPSLPGHATGSNSFGGATKLDEEGTEGVAFLPRNTQIIPNDTLRGLAKLNPAQLGRASGNVTQELHFHAEGAVLTDDLMRQFTSQASVIAHATTAQGIGANNQRQARRARYSRSL